MGNMTTVLLVLDGLGISDRKDHNAFYNAKTPILNSLMREYPYVRGLGAGMAVGLPNGQRGNAAAGFMNMGAGRIVYQETTRINNAIRSGAFFSNPVLVDTVNYCRKNDSSLHIMGLLSDGGAHSHIEHLYALLELARRSGLNRVYVHCFTDGRDTGIHNGIRYVEQLQTRMREIGVGEIASVSGRYYAMDRDNNYDRIKLAYLAMVQGEGNKAANASEAIQTAYDNGETDEFILPTVIVNGGVPVGTINDDDAVIFFNYRSDRARELTRAFCEEEFRHFKREKRLDIRFVCFAQYDPAAENAYVAFEPDIPENMLGEYLSRCGRSQLRLTESEVFPTVTYFFDGGIRESFDGEERLILRSVKNVKSYASCPEMNINSICAKLTEAVAGGMYDFILCNIPNADIVGHTADMEAVVTAIEAIDRCLGKVVECVLENNAVMFICSTHGKAEQLADFSTGEALTYHTMNPVPFILVNYDPQCGLREVGCLADVAPTLLEIMGLTQPKEMTGKSLIIR